MIPSPTSLPIAKRIFQGWERTPRCSNANFLWQRPKHRSRTSTLRLKRFPSDLKRINWFRPRSYKKRAFFIIKNAVAPLARLTHLPLKKCLKSTMTTWRCYSATAPNTDLTGVYYLTVRISISLSPTWLLFKLRHNFLMTSVAVQGAFGFHIRPKRILVCCLGGRFEAG